MVDDSVAFLMEEMVTIHNNTYSLQDPQFVIDFPYVQLTEVKNAAGFPSFKSSPKDECHIVTF